MEVSDGNYIDLNQEPEILVIRSNLMTIEEMEEMLATLRTRRDAIAKLINLVDNCLDAANS